MNTGINIKVGYNPLQFLFVACTPIIEINNVKHSRSWGENYFELQPNEYTIEIYTPYMFWRKCGANSIKIFLREGERREIVFKMPLTIFSKGSINEISPPNNTAETVQLLIPETCPHCKNPNTRKTRLCEWCGGQII